MSQFATEADLHKAKAEYFEAECEKLQAQVAMLREALGRFKREIAHELNVSFLSGIDNVLRKTESNWLAKHDQQVRDEAYERAACLVKQSLMDGTGVLSSRIRDMKGTK